jgi:hypothetical protein
LGASGLVFLLEKLSKAQMLFFSQDAVRELEVPFLLDSAKLVLGTLVKERDYICKSVKVFEVFSETHQEHTL